MGGGIGMGNTCKPMAVSFQCMTKSTTIIIIIIILKKERKMKKKKVQERDREKSSVLTRFLNTMNLSQITSP